MSPRYVSAGSLAGRFQFGSTMGRSETERPAACASAIVARTAATLGDDALRKGAPVGTPPGTG